MNSEQFREYWQTKRDSDHVLRPGLEVFRIGAAEIQPFLGPGKRVLEIGCGAGELFEHLVLDREKYVGVDFSPSVLEVFRAKHPGIRVEHGEATTWSARELFDVVLMNNVIQYCAPWMTLASIQNVSEMLAPGGVVFLGNIPNRHSRVAFLRGHFAADESGWSWLRARLFTFFNPTDRIGYWYTPVEIARFAGPLGLHIEVLGCVLYPYRFTALLTKRAPESR